MTEAFSHCQDVQSEILCTTYFVHMSFSLSAGNGTFLRVIR